jgi:hypothetical protein
MAMYNDNSKGGAAVITIIFFLIAGAVGLNKCNGADHKSANEEFKNWAKELKLAYDGVSCNGHDSDGDGYVSCTYMVDGEAHTVECAGSWNMQHGCRAPKTVLRTSTTVINSNNR